MPKNTTEALQDQVEQLMKENEKLKAATGRPSSPALSPSEPETPADRERLRVEQIQTTHHPSSSSSLGTHFGLSFQARHTRIGQDYSTSRRPF